MTVMLGASGARSPLIIGGGGGGQGRRQVGAWGVLQHPQTFYFLSSLIFIRRRGHKSYVPKSTPKLKKLSEPHQVLYCYRPYLYRLKALA